MGSLGVGVVSVVTVVSARLTTSGLLATGAADASPRITLARVSIFEVDRFGVENNLGTRIKICRLGKQRRPGSGIPKHCTMRASRVFLCVGLFKKISFGLLVEKYACFNC